MTDETSDSEPANTSALSDQTGVGKTTMLRQSLREMYENADFDGTFDEWFRKRSRPSEDDDTGWIDPKEEGQEDE